MRARSVVMAVCLALPGLVLDAQRPKSDVLGASGGDIAIIPITHGTLQIEHATHVILIDPARFGPGSTEPPPPPPPGRGGAPQRGAGQPVTSMPATAGQLTLFKGLRPPTMILVTDIHEDHLDEGALAAVKKPNTTIVAPAAASARISGAVTIANGETKTIDGVTIEAVPMYNLQPDPQFHQIFHEKGRGNGYILTLGGKRLYVAGDTACTPEMKALKNVDVAFLPMNLPFTMSPAEAADCAKAFKPTIVYPYHYFGEDPNVFVSALKGTGIDVRVRDWYHGVRPR